MTTEREAADYEETHECPHCQGEGVFLVCCDDICQGQGYCMHGDGEAICEACHGSGEVTPNDQVVRPAACGKSEPTPG